MARPRLGVGTTRLRGASAVQQVHDWLVAQGVDAYIEALANEALRSYARAVWSFLSRASDEWPDELNFGLAPIESRVVQEVLRRYVGR